MASSFFLGTIAAAIGFFTLYRKFRSHQDDKEIDSSSSSSISPPSSSTPCMDLSPFSGNCTHQVFPSFHGPDVRKAFLSHFLKEFRVKGIHPFIDNDIQRSKSIRPEIIKAIRGSKIAIVLLSRNYASSKWCLDELVEIMKCREELGQIVMTIFYKVDPSDVKRTTGDFGKVFKKTCSGKTMEDIGKWKQALEKVATIAGYHLNNWDNEAAMIEKIATDISNLLNYSTPSRDVDLLVGMRDHMEKMEPLLCLGSDEVRMIGVWGPSGIGKSAIARFLFHKHSHQFQFSTMMENIRGCWSRPCSDDYRSKLHLQKQMMSQIFNQNDIKIPHLGVAQERLKDKKVLVVLDDVDVLGQLDALAKETRWFGPKSRIIITTQDLRLLKNHGINHIYTVDFPPTSEALQILCMFAFGQYSPYDGFENLALQVTKLVGTLPLALKVMGSYFRGRSKKEWKEALPKLKTCLNADIQSVLKFSYDALDDKDKDLFLHIACFFNGQWIDKIFEEILAKTFPGVMQRLSELAEKALISTNLVFLEMHNLLAQLGREIVCRQSIHEPGQRQFLFDAKEICEVLIDHTGSKNVIGITLALFEIEEELYISERAFEGMSNLQFLRVYGFKDNKTILHLPRGLNYLSRKLRLLHWEGFPMRCLPFTFHMTFLVSLKLLHSKLEKLWEGTQLLTNLKRMDLSYSENLKELPDISTATNLECLNLHKCSSLLELPSSVGKANNLKELDLIGCCSLVDIPPLSENAIDLDTLDLSGCTNLVKLSFSNGYATNLHRLVLFECSSLLELPSSIKNSINLVTLNLSGCSSLVELPLSIGNLINLHELVLRECSSLVELPSSIGNAINLGKLDLSGCSSLVELPLSIGNLTNLHEMVLRECSSLVELPSSIGNAINLGKLDLSGCSNLVELPSSIGNLTNLQILDLSGCSSLVEIPSSIGNIVNFHLLDLSGCSSLGELQSSFGNAIDSEELTLQRCSSLVDLPVSIFHATNHQKLILSECSSMEELSRSSTKTAIFLSILFLNGCTSLVKLPSSIGNAINLERLELSGCSLLVELPYSIGNLTSLTELNLSGCSSLLMLPSSIGNATNLQKMNLCGCSNLIELSSSIGNITTLKILNLSGCSSLMEIPVSIGNVTRLEKLKLTNCSSLVKLPSSIGNLHNLLKLSLQGCFKLEALPININLESLNELDLTGCSMLKSFPEISVNIEHLNLVGTTIEEVPSSISSWSRLGGLAMSYSERLKESPFALDSITALHLTDTETQEVAPWVKGISHLHGLDLNGCKKLVSLPQLPDSLTYLDAENCEGLERLDCTFNNLEIRLNFANCFKLNKEARDLIIRTSSRWYMVLPGRQVPAYFTYRATGGLLALKLKQRPLPTYLRFKACILLVESDRETGGDGEEMLLTYSMTMGKHYVWCQSGYKIYPLLAEHLYTFEIETEKVTSSELLFEFEISGDKWEIGECGVVQLLEVPSPSRHLGL